MYNFEWDKQTGGYRLTTQTGKFVACEIRPVFEEELSLTFVVLKIISSMVSFSTTSQWTGLLGR